MKVLKENYQQIIIGLLVGISWFIIFTPSVILGVLETLITIFLVVVSRSLSQFFISEIISFSVYVFGVSLYLLIPGTIISAEWSAAGFVIFGIAGPLLINQLLRPKFKYKFDLVIEVIAAFLGLITAFIWRIIMPSNGLLALNSLYSSEDNAGIIGNLARANNFGIDLVGTRALGEWSNLFYSTAGVFTNLAQSPESQILLAPLIQWNLIIFSFWLIPICAMLTINFSLPKKNSLEKVILLLMVTSVCALLIWPFAAFGHISIIFAICFIIPVVGYIANEQNRNRLGFIGIIWMAGSAYLASNVWFPAIPLSLGILLLVPLLAKQIIINRILIWLTVLTAASGLAIRTLNIIRENSLTSLIEAPGFTRSASTALIAMWIVTIVLFSSSYRNNKAEYHPILLFLSTVLIANGGLWTVGTLLNENGSGYGANKFLLASICATLPVLLIKLASNSRSLKTASVLVVGLSFLFVVLVSQSEVKPFIRSQLIVSSPIWGNTQTRPVVNALLDALKEEPDFVYCGSNTDKADLVNSIPGYECSRWASSLMGKDDPDAYIWRYSLIGTVPQNEITGPIANAGKSKVILIKIIDPNFPSEAWWESYIPDNWQKTEL